VTAAIVIAVRMTAIERSKNTAFSSVVSTVVEAIRRSLGKRISNIGLYCKRRVREEIRRPRGSYKTTEVERKSEDPNVLSITGSIQVKRLRSTCV
jgi:hypothetical protein